MLAKLGNYNCKTSTLTPGLATLFKLYTNRTVNFIQNDLYMKISYFISLAILLVSCSSNEKDKNQFADCKYGEPIAIFNPGLEALASHHFEIDRAISTEKLQFKDGLEVTLIQSGCDERKQEFQFKLVGDYQDKADKFWIDKTLDLLQKLGRLSPEYQVFNAWAEALSLQGEQIRLAEATEVQPGFFVRIDKILSQDHAILLLILSERP